MVKKIQPANNAQTNGTSDVSDEYVGVGDYHVMSFDMSDVADFNVNNVILDKSHVKSHNGKSFLFDFIFSLRRAPCWPRVLCWLASFSF
jgi:hypothetical protein